MSEEAVVTPVTPRPSAAEVLAKLTAAKSLQVPVSETIRPAKKPKVQRPLIVRLNSRVTNALLKGRITREQALQLATDLAELARTLPDPTKE